MRKLYPSGQMSRRSGAAPPGTCGAQTREAQMLGHDRRSMADEVTPSTAGLQAWIDEGALAALMTATHGDPFSVLGMHVVADAVVVRALLPGADAVEVTDEAGRRFARLQRQGDSALLAGIVPADGEAFIYRLKVNWSTAGTRHDGAGSEDSSAEPDLFDDTYIFGSLIEDLDVWLLTEGS